MKSLLTMAILALMAEGALGQSLEKHHPPEEARASAERMFAEAAAMEQQGKAAEAVRLYVRAARAGSDKAARRLGEIYEAARRMEAERRKLEFDPFIKRPHRY